MDGKIQTRCANPAKRDILKPSKNCLLKKRVELVPDNCYSFLGGGAIGLSKDSVFNLPACSTGDES